DGTVSIFHLLSGNIALDEPIQAGALAEAAAAQGVSNRNPVVGHQLSDDEEVMIVGRQNGEISFWESGFNPSFGRWGMLPGLVKTASFAHGSQMFAISANARGSRVVTLGTDYGMTKMGTMILDPVRVRVWDRPKGWEIARITSLT